MDGLVDACLWSFLGAKDGADYCKRRDMEDVITQEKQRNDVRQEAARRRFLFRTCVVEPRRRVRTSARWKRVKQLGGAELEETLLELSDVLDVVNEDGDKPFREMVSLFARVVVKVYGGRINSLREAFGVIDAESSILAPILVKAYFKEDGALAEITTALEAIFDGASSRDIASMMIPFLVKAYLIKRTAFEGREARERASFKEMGTNVLLAFRKISRRHAGYGAAPHGRRRVGIARLNLKHSSDE